MNEAPRGSRDKPTLQLANQPETPAAVPAAVALPPEPGAEPTVTASAADCSASDRGSALVLSHSLECEERASALPFFVVAIGVGAGELEVLEELLSNLPRNAGLALVLLPVGTYQQPDLLIEMLRTLTPMPVREVVSGLPLQPDHLYVPPAQTLLFMERGALVLTPCPKEAQAVMRIDGFLRSLAAEMRSQAIGIVLAGCGADGALGLKAIKSEGGIAIVQTECAPQPDPLPGTAAAGAVDLVLLPKQMGEELSRITSQLAGMLTALGDKSDKPSDEQHQLSKLYLLLRRATGVDFSLYKQTTLRRRIARRMVVQRISSLKEYTRHLQTSPSELKELYEDMLINVTRFFRDPEMFESLRTELLPLILGERSPEQPIRIWVPGCATGEEVYSLAITLLEHLSTVPFEVPVQIFGTDISERSIERARAAVYPESLLAELPPERLRRFFVRVEGGYQVVKRVRDRCIFARQNLASDPPFSRLDLISCRNVLIYLGPALQKTIIPTFHYALKPTGFLLLGNSETIRDYSNLFVLLDKRHKFYAKNTASLSVAQEFGSRVVPRDIGEPLPYDRLSIKEGGNEMELQRAADRIILTRFGPAGVVINEHADILQSRGHTSPFLELPSGTATLNLLRMVNESIACELRDGLYRAVADDTPVRLENLRLTVDDKSSDVTIEILPLQSQGRSTRCFLVLFLPDSDLPRSARASAGPSPPLSSADEKDRENTQLRNDLASTKQYLQSLLEERDATNQELISANEEIQSSNEELQSINEELETAKEELQSANEELQTVNEELSNRNLELGQISNDLVNLLNSITIPALMLGNDLRIRQYTPSAERMMNVRPADIGRPIGEIRLNLNLDDLEPILLDVLETLSAKELEVQDRAGRWHLLRARPYRTADNKIDGVVMVLVDIDQIRRSQKALMDARDFAHAVVTSAQMPLVVLGPELRVKLASRAFFELCGLPAEQMVERPFNELAARCLNIDVNRQLLSILNAKPGEPEEFELEHETGGPDSKQLQLRARAILADNERVMLVTVQDITARKLAEHLLQAEKERLKGQVQVTAQALDRSQEELRALAASLFTAQEEERRRVSRELHDDLAQKVALLDLHTERLVQGLSEPVPRLRRQLDELRQHITDLSVDLRRIAYQLHPSILDDLGLSFALKQLSEEFGRREDMPVRFTCGESTPATSPMVGGALYRITQEALRNIAKHAGKTQVNVSLTASQHELRLQIRDYGNGIEPGQARGRGMGILNMEERARLAGGRFSMKAYPGKGVSILVRVPLRQNRT